MRINPLEDGDLKSTGIEGKKKLLKKSKVKSSEKASFFDVLEEAEAEELEKNLSLLVDEIVASGNELVRSPTPQNLSRYKEAIKKFLKLIEKKLYKISERVDTSTGAPRLHVIVEKIDEKLKELAEAVFSSERVTINLASKVEEINGLILDLYK